MIILERRMPTRPIPTTAPPTPSFVIGHVDFHWTGDALEPGTPALADHPRVLHSVLVRAPGPRMPVFQDYRRATGPWRALCGAEVLAVTGGFFDDAARWSCRRCGELVNRWLDDDTLVRWELEIPFGR